MGTRPTTVPHPDTVAATSAHLHRPPSTSLLQPRTSPLPHNGLRNAYSESSACGLDRLSWPVKGVRIRVGVKCPLKCSSLKGTGHKAHGFNHGNSPHTDSPPWQGGGNLRPSLSPKRTYDAYVVPLSQRDSLPSPHELIDDLRFLIFEVGSSPGIASFAPVVCTNLQYAASLPPSSIFALLTKIAMSSSHSLITTSAHR